MLFLSLGKTRPVLWAKDLEAMDNGFSCYEASHRKALVFNEGHEMLLHYSVNNLLCVCSCHHYAGMFQLVHYLSQDHLLGKKSRVKFVVDTGTGTTSIGIGVEAMSLGAVMLADTLHNYKRHEDRLLDEFTRQFLASTICSSLDTTIRWIERQRPRKFGKVLEGEVEMCWKIAQETCVLVVPMYTLAARERATELAQEDNNASIVVMLHTEDTLGMFGLAQRYKCFFTNLND